MKTKNRSADWLIRVLLTGMLMMLLPSAFPANDEESEAKVREAIRLFFDLKTAESVEAFDKVIELTPKSAPYLWQRGLALYYAGKYKEGRKQFELHQTVNPHDVENAAWHYFCVARSSGVGAARKALLAIEGDARIPMKELHELLAGKGTEEAVLRAAQNPANGVAEVQNQLCLAHLYLGLYHEALGHTEQAKAHILNAATTYATENYMGKTAQMHVKLRGWDK